MKMNYMEISIKRKPKMKWKRNSVVEKYDNWNEKKNQKLEGFKGKSEQSEERISELEDIAMEMITETKRFKEKQTEPKRPFGHHQETKRVYCGRARRRRQSERQREYLKK